MDRFNPRLNEFRRIDSNGDEKLTFTEFLLGDRPYIEAQSRNFHKHDLNGDGVVTREEFEGYYRRQDEEQREREIQADNFFKQLMHIRRRKPQPLQFESRKVFLQYTAQNEKVILSVAWRRNLHQQKRPRGAGVQLSVRQRLPQFPAELTRRLLAARAAAKPSTTAASKSRKRDRSALIPPGRQISNYKEYIVRNEKVPNFFE
ncbi:hypothetical protein L596_004650 [Steinernema carpocapsae]|nr:hypothetical protein L596_004650 [Steinernema carpocapsae]